LKITTLFNIYDSSTGITTLSNPQISEKKVKAPTATSNQRKTCKETHRIRVFVTEKDKPKPELRSTERYQTIMTLIESQKPAPGSDEEQDMQRGYLGPCLLSDLEFFEQGKSFLSDSLHTLYGGAMVYDLLLLLLLRTVLH
jgi:hypothetical protein